jgi:hypothetical protein
MLIIEMSFIDVLNVASWELPQNVTTMRQTEKDE